MSFDFNKLVEKGSDPRPIQKTDNSISTVKLTPHQQEALDKVLDLLRAGHKRILLLGSAGCGKTVLASELARILLKDHTINPDYNNGSIFVCAPTNKALSILQNKIKAPVEFKTIHSACKLNRFVNPRTGEATFVRSKSYSRDDMFPHNKITLVDECSMLNSDFIGGNKKTNYRGYLDDYNFPIIFIGDEKQLNPVGEEFSPVFHQGWPEVHLTEIIRQGEGNPIIDLSRDLDMIFFKKPKVINGKGYVYNNVKQQIIEGLVDANGSDLMKYLSWVNKDVDEMNLLVRQTIYGDSPNKIELNETIVFNSPFESFYTNKEVKVEEVDIIIDNIPIPRYDTKFDRDGKPIGKTDQVKMKYYRVNNAFNVVHEDSDYIFKRVLDTITYHCSKHGWDWRGKYYFAELFADIKYNHAITVHKSQGSTYKHAAINIGNIMFNNKIEERNRMLYTAITRASDLVILNNV